MVVRTQSNGREVTGLYIGSRNARRHFRKHTDGIELELGHLRIHCQLAPDFWRGRPEICDSRLGDWLKSRIFHERTCRAPVPIMLIPVEKNCFKLHPVQLPPASLKGVTGTALSQAPDGKRDGRMHSVTAAIGARSFVATAKSLSR